MRRFLSLRSPRLREAKESCHSESPKLSFFIGSVFSEGGRQNQRPKLAGPLHPSLFINYSLVTRNHG